jgi:hypothetical protein
VLSPIAQQQSSEKLPLVLVNFKHTLPICDVLTFEDV